MLEFDNDSLEIVRKSFSKTFGKKVCHRIIIKYRQMEICELLLPFLEIEQGDQRLKALEQIEDIDISSSDIEERN